MARACLAYCRPGFEKEAIAELQDYGRRMVWNDHARGKSDQGFVLYEAPDIPEAGEHAPRWRDLIFARQLVMLDSPAPLELDSHDRITPLVERLKGQTFRDLLLESPDTNDGKALSGFFKSFGNTLRSVLDKRAILRRKATRTLHLFFLDGTTVHVGYSTPDNASPWPQGIPRLKFPAAAPSRSTLKLEEAFHLFLDEETRTAWLREGLTAVDLGAAPGGWTWQLVQRGLQVTAIDNGPMDKALMQNGQVEHLRTDGFRYRPERPVTWLVCDMIESPLRVAETVADWVAAGHAQRAVFNLKLPMKRRHEEVQRCLGVVRARLDNAGVRFRLAAKQLYHDREEITVYLWRN